ncbi:hypothetical protein EAJ01_09590 [Bacteroides cellulosilyticus]|uniref:Uncharacterized protein n=1 Tax=Bacteroides cellulosilyticus DSM 14838 TaxID=537012 RepID=E2NHL1_9BACE|nr:hypothetical protein BACCELL_03788 [Bacteroides cellulosilyticus DSM 14838]RYU18165.1 hypothetical protein EAJ01_09590 [Bacteroides cellulosilyticus]
MKYLEAKIKALSDKVDTIITHIDNIIKEAPKKLCIHLELSATGKQEVDNLPKRNLVKTMTNYERNSKSFTTCPMKFE